MWPPSPSAASVCGVAVLLCGYTLLLCSLVLDRVKFGGGAPDDDDPNGILAEFLAPRRRLRLDSDALEWRFDGDGDGELFDCEQLALLADGAEFVDAGYTKSVFRVRFDGTDFALKLVNADGLHLAACAASGRSAAHCHGEASRKLLKEIALLRQLHHPSVVKLRGYCIPRRPLSDGAASQPPLAALTDLGQPADLLRLLQLDWEQRLQLLDSVSRLLVYLSESPLGPLTLGDLRRQQFVRSDGALKVVDVDDVQSARRCSSDSDCNQTEPSSASRLVCRSDGRCAGETEFRNVGSARDAFFNQLLPHGAPVALEKHTDELLSRLNLSLIGAADLQAAVDQLVAALERGSDAPHADASVDQRFRRVNESDQAGQDYACSGSRSESSCELSVASTRHAMALCLAEATCAAFVHTGRLSWTGRQLVQLKTNVTSPSRSPGKTLFVRT